MVALLAIANIICPLSFDMYTPAVPLLPGEFGTSAAMIPLWIYVLTSKRAHVKGL